MFYDFLKSCILSSPPFSVASSPDDSILVDGDGGDRDRGGELVFPVYLSVNYEKAAILSNEINTY